jgi:hypothetical protein
MWNIYTAVLEVHAREQSCTGAAIVYVYTLCTLSRVPQVAVVHELASVFTFRLIVHSFMFQLLITKCFVLSARKHCYRIHTAALYTRVTKSARRS